MSREWTQHDHQKLWFTGNLKEGKKRGHPRRTWKDGIYTAMNETDLRMGEWNNRRQWNMKVGRLRQKCVCVYVYIYIYIYNKGRSTQLIGHNFSYLCRLSEVQKSSLTRCQAQCAWQRPPTTRPTTFHVWKARGRQCSFRLLMMDGVSPETCWASYKYGIIKFWYIVASWWIFLYE